MAARWTRCRGSLQQPSGSGYWSHRCTTSPIHSTVSPHTPLPLPPEKRHQDPRNQDDAHTYQNQISTSLAHLSSGPCQRLGINVAKGVGSDRSTSRVGVFNKWLHCCNSRMSLFAKTGKGSHREQL